MFETKIEEVAAGRVQKYKLFEKGRTLSYGDVIDLWQADPKFCLQFSDLLASSPYSAFRWETPCITNISLDQPFQFVLLNEPSFSRRSTDALTFSKKFSSVDKDHGIVSFANLSGDCRLVVPSPAHSTDPSPGTTNSAYGHLAAFVREAPEDQRAALWRVVAETATEMLGSKPIWINTAGGGVAWLHVRLDSRPKYYGYAPFRVEGVPEE